MNLDLLLIFAYTITLLMSFIVILAKSKPNDPKSKNKYSVSVIIPVWNEEKTIGNTINHLLECKENYIYGDFEIVVVDNNSTDKSLQVIKDLSKKYNFIKVLTETKQGKSYAFNKGANLSKSDLIACVDADSYPDKDSFNKVVGYFDDSKVGAVTAKMTVHNPNSIVKMFQDIEYMYSNLILMAFDFYDSIYVTKGPLSVYRRDLFLNIGGFLPASLTPTEDMEITFRIRKAGYLIRASKEAKVRTNVMDTWAKLYRQRIRWNRGSLINFSMHRDMLLNPKYGFFSIVIMPLVSISILMLAVLIYYFLEYLYKGVYLILYKIYYHIYFGVNFNIVYYLDYYARNFILLVPDYILFIIIVFSIWLYLYFSSIIETGEKITLKRIIYILILPLIYTPIQIYFWISSIFVTVFFNYDRWR